MFRDGAFACGHGLGVGERILDNQFIDRLARRVAAAPSRRHVVALFLSPAVPRLLWSVPEAAAKKNKRNKPKKNEFGCLNVGKKCNGKDNKCCSGICKGNRPKKGKKDKSKCAAHNVQECQDDQDACLMLATPCGAEGACFRTTGKASFCGTGDGECTVCTRDSDCEAGFGPGAACAICASDCGSTGTTACIPAAANQPI
jgi:hypothetical protein